MILVPPPPKKKKRNAKHQREPPRLFAISQPTIQFCPDNNRTHCRSCYYLLFWLWLIYLLFHEETREVDQPCDPLGSRQCQDYLVLDTTGKANTRRWTKKRSRRERLGAAFQSQRSDQGKYQWKNRVADLHATSRNSHEWGWVIELFSIFKQTLHRHLQTDKTAQIQRS